MIRGRPSGLFQLSGGGAVRIIWRLRHHPLFGLHFTLSSGTLKHTFSEQLSVPFSGKLQHLRFTYVAAG